MTKSEGSLLKVLLPVIIGGLVVFTATTLYTDYWKKPNIDSSFLATNLETSISFENTGQMQADNLRIEITPGHLPGRLNTNVINFTMNSDSQNATLRKENDSWVIEARKFPVGGYIETIPVLRNARENETYFVTMASDQGVKSETLDIDPGFERAPETAPKSAAETALNADYGSLLSPEYLSPTWIALAASFVIGIVYTSIRIRDGKRSQRFNEFLEKINDKVCDYYVIQGPEIIRNQHIKNLTVIRNDMKQEFKDGKINRSDLETLDNRILESMEKMKNDGDQTAPKPTGTTGPTTTQGEDRKPQGSNAKTSLTS